MRKARLRTIAYIPQGAMNSLNPVHAHRPPDGKTRCIDHGVAGDAATLRLARRSPASILDADGRCSAIRTSCRGGMKQRVCIAIGILLGPKVIIADEPTSALDVVPSAR